MVLFLFRYLGIGCIVKAVVDVEHLTGFQPCMQRDSGKSDPYYLADVIHNYDIVKSSFDLSPS